MDDGHPDMPRYLSHLGHAQQTRFIHLGNLSDLENSISNITKAVELADDGHLDKPGYLSNLGNAQQTRFSHLGDLSDLENATHSVTFCARSVSTILDAWPQIACQQILASQRTMRLGQSPSKRFGPAPYLCPGHYIGYTAIYGLARPHLG